LTEKPPAIGAEVAEAPQQYRCRIDQRNRRNNREQAADHAIILPRLSGEASGLGTAGGVCRSALAGADAGALRGNYRRFLADTFAACGGCTTGPVVPVAWIAGTRCGDGSLPELSAFGGGVTAAVAAIAIGAAWLPKLLFSVNKSA
jgi:hypothetical protein